MSARLALLSALCLLAASCAAPTIQQRQTSWERYRDSVRATCAVGANDVSMPADVRAWCDRVMP